MSETTRDSKAPQKPDGGPLAVFAVLVRATAARDFRGATAARKALRCYGWSVAPLTKGGPIG